MTDSREPTQWSRIDAGDLDYVVRRFWRPVQRHITRRVGRPELAEELTQDLFLRFLEREVVRRADRERGPFRRFLFHCAEQLVIEHYRAAGAQKRGRPAALDAAGEPADDDLSPAERFDREWYLSLINQARRAVKAHYLEQQRDLVYRAFRLFYFGDDQPGRWSQRAIADALGISVAAVNNHVHRARGRFADALRAALTDGLPADEVDAELRELAAFLERHRIAGAPPSSLLDS